MDYTELYRHPVRSVRSWTRKQYRTVGTPMWKQLREAEGDWLAMRELTLRTNGRGTLVNWIYGDHGLTHPSLVDRRNAEREADEKYA